VEATPLHGDERGVLAELALKPNAAIAPHSNSNLTYLLVIEGGGFVQVGEERARVAAGDAVVWPPNVIHAAWTELTPLRAIVVEFASPAAVNLLLDGAVELGESSDAAANPKATPAEGALAAKPEQLPLDRESPEGEPW
jgi:ectoine hydroxylase-related dioxygenase (phytanoyl-CoA dioxygenase family)